ncbi:hypothetical protein VaNZ11_003772 [Volvox africanus]|uniref:Reticulon domain-containing protein n=1 Tax=Volvox africanus TaxID=51714 RepID=A0ABQ5RWH1_9CHLO|nr:hypothetical protein VaNZ11_003772 [Volvox africanus]
MLYVCSCGFTAATATAFYKHLAASKESGSGHQLMEARFSDKLGKDGSKPDYVPKPVGQQAPVSWSEDYLVVDQQDTPAQGPSAASEPVLEAFPVSSPASQEQQGPRAHELDDISLRDLQGMSRVWSGFYRQRSSATPPPVSASRAGSAAVTGVEAKEADSDSDEVEIVDDNPEPRIRARQYRAGSPSGTAAQAALRMSGSVVNAMVVGLSPWRWFGNGGSSPRDAPADLGPKPLHTGPVAQSDAMGAAAGGDEANMLEAVQGMQPRQGDGRRVTSSDGLQPLGWPTASLQPVHAVHDVLTWQNPWRTTRIFGAGLYLAICAQQLIRGHELLQPSTAIFGICFCLLLRNVLREAAASYRRTQRQQHQTAESSEANGSAQSLQPEDEVDRRKAAMMMQQRLEAMLQGVALWAARYGAAVVVLTFGLLSGRRAITSALVAVLLWLGMVLGELRVISQPMFWLICYIAVFTIPAAYYRCHHAMDAGVEAALRFTVRVLMSGSRTALLTSAGVALVLLVALPLNFVLRASLAAGSAFGVLLWQSEMGRRGYGAGTTWLTGKGMGVGQLKIGDGGRLPTGPPEHKHKD